jgi:hypothetical protein
MRDHLTEIAHEVQRLHKEVDLERKKTSRLTKENEKLRKDNIEILEKTSGENSSEVLKHKIVELR